MSLILALSGDKESGKDTVARHLADAHGFAHVAFADKLRQLLGVLNPLVNDRGPEAPIRFVDAVTHYGYDLAKKRYPELRRLMKIFGTKVCREEIADTIWIDFLAQTITAMEAAGANRFIISDLRFINEATWIRRAGGFHCRIFRPGAEEQDRSHRSVSELDRHPYNFSIQNDGSLDDLYALADELAIAAIALKGRSRNVER